MAATQLRLGKERDAGAARAEKVGQIRVVPVPAPKRAPPPLANPIIATVRAGDACRHRCFEKPPPRGTAHEDRPYSSGSSVSFSSARTPPGSAY